MSVASAAVQLHRSETVASSPRRRTSRHLRLFTRHRVRVVRLLSLRHPGAVLRGPVLSAGQRDGGAAVGLRGLRRGLPGAPVRRPGVRPPGRPGRPQVHLPGHHPVHGRLDLRGRPAADLLRGRLARAGADGRRCVSSRAWRWAASMAVRRPTWPSMRRAAAAATPRAGSRPRRRSASSCRSRSSRSAAPRWTPRRSPTGAGASRSWSR